MKPFLYVLSVASIVLALSQTAGAYVVENVNWADDVADHSSAIQNYGGTLMDPDNEFWLTGPPDADADGNGYAWDPGDPDYVAGWKTTDPNEFFIVHFDVGLPDLEGADLDIHGFAGPQAGADVLASTDGVDYVQIGVLGGGTPGYLKVDSFDFAGLWGVQYVKVQRTAIGAKTGLFVDAICGYLAPGDANADGTVDLLDLGIVGDNWNGTGKGWEDGDFNDDGVVDLLDLGIVGDNWHVTVESVVPSPVPEPAALTLLLGAIPILCLFRRRRSFGVGGLSPSRRLADGSGP